MVFKLCLRDCSRNRIMRGFMVLTVCLGIVMAWTLIHLVVAQEAKCRYYKVQAASLNISKEPRGDSAFIDVLDSGDVVCVTQEQKAGGRDWVFLDQKVMSNERRPVGGWANLRLLQPLSPAESAVLDKKQTPASQPSSQPSSTLPTASDVPLKFNEPVPFGPFPVNGKSIEQLANDIPMFPPIEGLDEAVWKKNCTACHVWDRRQLCEQGASYAKNPKSVLRHPHPYGGAYKVALMQWAKSGCQ